MATTDNAVSRVKGPAGYLHIDDGGTGGLPVIFAHSFGGSTQQWAAQLAHLRGHSRAIAYDLRGHGASAAPSNNDYDVIAQAEDIAAVVDDLGLKRFVLVGHSMGGSAAIAYAGKHPERVAGLMLVGTPGKSPEEMSKPIIASLESDKYQQVMDNYMKQLLTNAKPEVNTEVMDGMKNISREASTAIIKAVFQFDPLPLLRNYPGPKMIVSTSMENQPHTLSQSFPDVPHKVIEGTSHWMQMDKPEEFNKLLDEFLEIVSRES